MHEKLEIVMPPTDDIEASIEEVLRPFYEGLDLDDEDSAGLAFWDWYDIGGRFAGDKVKAKLGATRLRAFSDLLRDRKITVSGLRVGKEELQPSSQIPLVDALWREHFPDSGLSSCPFFKHSGKSLDMDVCRLDDMPQDLTAERVIIAADSPIYNKRKAEFMLVSHAWNGCNLMPVAWDGKVASAIAKHIERIAESTFDYREQNTPKPDWLVVTIDYHS